MSTPPVVHFETEASARSLTDQEVEARLAGGAVISNTALAIRQAKARPGFGTPVPYTRPKLARQVHAIHDLTARRAIEISDPSLDRSDETAIAINPRHPRNIVAGAATFDGQQFTNSAYVSLDGGHSWKTVTALANTDEGAGLAFDDSGNCYYATMQGGFMPVCSVSRDGGLTWARRRSSALAIRRPWPPAAASRWSGSIASTPKPAPSPWTEARPGPYTTSPTAASAPRHWSVTICSPSTSSMPRWITTSSSTPATTRDRPGPALSRSSPGTRRSAPLPPPVHMREER